MEFRDYYEIEKLINRYAVCADRGDARGIAEHYARCRLILGGDRVMEVAQMGKEAFVRWYEAMIRIYPDSRTPKTRRIISTIVIDHDGPGRARSQCYVVAFQATPALPLQPIIAGTLYDQFERVDGQWWIVERREELELWGDMSHHLLA